MPIEARFRRALVAVATIATLGFAAHAAWSYQSSLGAREIAESTWRVLWQQAAERCDQAPGSFHCERKEEYSRHRSELWAIYHESIDQAQTSALGALATPLIALGIYFLSRWIWTGKLRTSPPPPKESTSAASDSSEARPVYRKYWTYLLGIPAALLVIVLLLAFRPGATAAALISGLIQAIGLAVVVGIVALVRRRFGKGAK
jgi:hypothetical protein